MRWQHRIRAGSSPIELAAPEIRKNRQETTRTELTWLKALPNELVRVRPVLSVAYAYALFGSGELEAVEAWLRAAEHWLDPPAERRAQPEGGLPRLLGWLPVWPREWSSWTRRNFAGCRG